MLTIAEVSGLIAAAVMIVKYWLPSALVIILVRLVGNENTAATWSTVNRTISTTLWPLILRADSTGTSHLSRSAAAISWTMTLGAALIILAGVVTPLGLRDEIVPGSTQPVQFEYVRDLTSWGKITPERPNLRFGRHCEFGRRINCPGQYQGVDFVEISPGVFQSVKRDNSSTVNTTVPANYTAMFSSATADARNTVSGLFDVQYRRWTVTLTDIIDNGEPQVAGDYRYIELLIPEDDILLKEGLIVDVRDNPGIGFRNHTVPTGLAHGGTWSEDLTWLEPVTRCADTNLTVEIKLEATKDSFGKNTTISLVDRGAFRDLDITALETRPWTDNQTLDLFGRAHKAARMYNVLAARFLNLSLPFNSSVGTIPTIDVTNSTLEFNSILFSDLDRDDISIDELRGLDNSFSGADPNIPLPDNFVPHYPDGFRRLFASNLTAIGNICKGFYVVDETSIDGRASNITNPMVECGLLVGAGQATGGGVNDTTSTPLDDLLQGREIKRKNLYVCATGVRASVKTVDFRYNGTDGELSNLRVDRISDKVYPDQQSKPLWAVETSGDKRMTFDPLWGIVNNSYETTEGFYTMRSEKLWLPTVVSPAVTFGERQAFDSLAAVTAPGLNVANLYSSLPDNKQHTGELSYPLVQRFTRLSANETAASQIPSLILTDILASLLVGTKTAIHTAPVEFPAKLAVNDQASGLPHASVVPYQRVIRYDLRYAVPGFVVLALLLVVAIWSAFILLPKPKVMVRTIRDMYNQTSAGRLATMLLRPDHSDPNQSSSKWLRRDGKLNLKFGRIGSQSSDYFLRLEDEKGGYKPAPHRGDTAQETSRDEMKEGMRLATVPV